jgi:hypothetical protein
MNFTKDSRHNLAVLHIIDKLDGLIDPLNPHVRPRRKDMISGVVNAGLEAPFHRRVVGIYYAVLPPLSSE